MERFAFRKLRVYQTAKTMVKEVNRVAGKIPRHQMDLVWQLRRAARSVVLNIAEGAGEVAPKEKARIYRIAKRSAFETIAALDLALDEGFLAQSDLETVLEKLDAVIGMLTTMSKKAEQRSRATPETPRPRPRPRPKPQPQRRGESGRKESPE
jgi:four helix bundle protein